MRGQLLLSTIVFGLAAVLGLGTLALNAHDDEPLLGDVLMPVALATISGSQIVTALGKRRDGTVGTTWIIGLVVLGMASLITGAVGEILSTRSIGYRLGIGLACLGAVATVPAVVIEKRRGRLGLPRSTKRKAAR